MILVKNEMIFFVNSLISLGKEAISLSLPPFVEVLELLEKVKDGKEEKF
jgi:hypothetical protein